MRRQAAASLHNAIFSEKDTDMKIKIISILALLAVCVTLLVVLVFCKKEHVHDYVWTETAATCTEKGIKTGVCRDESCKDTVTEEINALGHELVSHSGKAAGCTEDGYADYDTCSREGCDYTTYQSIDKLGHKYVNDICENCSDKLVEYTVSVKSEGGLSMSGITVYVYADAEMTRLVSLGATDKNGSYSVKLSENGSYAVKLDSIPNGYSKEQFYSISSTNSKIEISSSVIVPDTNAQYTIPEKYKLGDVMYDFEVTTTDGKALKLSELLKTKKAVFINFWYTGCGPCKTEFPYMQSAALEYDEIAVICLDPDAQDTVDSINAFKTSEGIVLDLAKIDPALFNAFKTGLYPTSVMIDRYGVICLIETGAITDSETFGKIFNYFDAENYEQGLFSSHEQIPSCVDHEFSDWTETKAPTCVEKGVEQRHCTVEDCPKVETREVNALGHDPISHEGKEATCSEDGYKAYETCSKCDYTSYEVIPMAHKYENGICKFCESEHDHEFAGEWYGNTATCKKAGEEYRNCTGCDVRESRATAKRPNCEYKDKVCIYCGDKDYSLPLQPTAKSKDEE